MEVLGGSGVGIMDLNDALISNGIPPRDPVAGALWIDTSTGTSVLKVYINNKWETQKLDVSKLDPDLATKLQGVIDTLGTIANDGVLTFSDRVTLSKELGEILGTLPSKSTGNVYPSALPDYTVLDASGSGTFANMRLRATDVGIGTDTAWYKDVETTYKALNSFLSTFTPKPWDITTANKAINVVIATPDVFRQRFLDYYMAELRLATETEKQAKIKAEEYADKLTDGSSVVDKTEILSGNPVFTDKADDAVVHVGIDGKSEQNAGSGKNLTVSDNGWKSKSATAVIVSFDNKTAITKIDFATTADGIHAYLALNKELVVGTTYTASFEAKVTNSEGQGKLDLAFYNVETGSGKQSIASETIAVNSWVKISRTITVSVNGSNGLFVSSSSYKGRVLEIKNIQVEENSKETSYEPPAPSPDYPSAINSLNNVDVVSSVGKENLATNSYANFSNPSTNFSGGINYIINLGNVPTQNMKVGDKISISILIDYSNILSATGQTARVWIQGSGNVSGWNGGGFPSSPQTTISGSGQQVLRATAILNETHLRNTYWSAQIRVDYVQSGSIRVKEFKTELGDATPFNPNLNEIQPDTQSPTLYKTNILLSEPLRSVGDVKDRVFLDTDGLWKVERNVGEYTFTGDESFSTEQKLNKIEMVQANTQGIPNKKIAGDMNGLSNRFKVVTNITNELDSDTGIRVHTGYNVTRFKFSPKELLGLDFASSTGTQIASGFKVWLKSNPTTVVYELAIPTTETLPDDLQQKLNNIQSYKGSNYVYTMANVEPNLNAKFKSNAWYRNYSIQRDLTEVDNVANALKNFTDTAFADGIIERAEAQAISEHLNTLRKENDDLSNQYNGIYANVLLIGTPKTNLYNSKVAYNTAYANLMASINTAISGNKTTTAQKSDVDAKFTAYSGALKLLTQRMNEALTTISGKQATDAVDGMEIGGVNLLGNFTKGSTVRNGLTTTINPDGSVTLKGTVTASTDIYLLGSWGTSKQEANRFIKAGKYTMSVQRNNSLTNVTLKIYQGTASINATSTTKTWNQTSDTYYSVVYLTIEAGTYDETLYLQLEKGNKQSSWVASADDIQEDINKKTGAPVRYIRDWVNGSTLNTNNHWVALQAIALDGTDRARGILPTSDQALTNPAYLTNGSTASSPYVQGVSTGIQYIQIDLGKTYYDISDIRVWHYHADGRAYNNTKTEISVDGTNWEPLYDSLTQGTYPETAEGNILPTTVVDRLRIITSRVALAEQVITPEAITGTVMSQETFVEWKENVDTKANGEDVANLMLEMGNVQDTLNGTDTTEGIITKMSTVEQKADSWTADISELKEITGVQGSVTEKVTAYMEFKMTGLEIGKSDSDMKVNISNSQIDFMDKGVSVAYINGQKMFITQVEITESLIIGNHKIEKLDGNSDITIVSWVGKGG